MAILQVGNNVFPALKSFENIEFRSNQESIVFINLNGGKTASQTFTDRHRDRGSGM